MDKHVIRVKGLREGTTEEAVRDFFSRLGEVLACDINGTEAKISFQNDEDFNEALNMNNEQFDDGVTITVEPFENVSEPQEEAFENDGGVDKRTNEASVVDSRKRFCEENKVAVRHLPDDVTEDQLRELFRGVGEIVDFFLEPRRRYAFVGFENSESVDVALKLSGKEMNGVAIEVERKRTGNRENILESKVVVKNIPYGATEESVRRFFASVGEPVDIFIHDKKQFAFVGFADEKSCLAAIDMNGFDFDGQRVQIERRQKQRCYKCNREGHVALQCHMQEQTCRNCGRAGHMARDCRMTPRSYDRRVGPHNGGGYNFAHMNNDRRGDFGRRGAYNDRRGGGDYDRRRPRSRSRSGSYERRHRRRSRSRSRSRSPKRFARERDRSRSPSRRRYTRDGERGRPRDSPRD
uniref:Putative RNA-binding protein n=1 Tax=Trypanosoma congolense (strain IL3000) TaxID=1068625 RepID=G0UJG7_TRYCI|nr:putative RNA-binding protein [Trypanosoma congolense IL3000]